MRVYQKMRPIGIALWLTGCVRMLKDGDGFSYVFRRWHPLTYLLMVVMVVPCAVVGEKLSTTVPLSLSKFWQANRDQLQWVAPWTVIETLKPFRFNPLNATRLEQERSQQDTQGRDENHDWQDQ
jgi:hypothetical protein